MLDTFHFESRFTRELPADWLCCKLLPRCAKAAINGSDDLSGRFEFELLAEKLDCLSQS